MARGRPSKKPRPTPDVSGLRNQSRHSAFSTPQPTPPRSQAPSPDGNESDLEEDDEELDDLIHFDSLKTNLANAEAYSDGEEEVEVEEWEGFSKEDLAETMIDMFEVECYDRFHGHAFYTRFSFVSFLFPFSDTCMIRMDYSW